MAIDRCDRATWPEVLSLEDVATIYGASPNTVRHQVTPRSRVVPRVPQPFMKYPLRWRKADVVRHLDGGRRVA